MKGIIIYEDYRGKEVVEAIKLGMVNYECKSDTSDGSWINNLSGVRKEVTQAYCNKEDTYDFEIGALIALMKMCGKDKVTKACDELYKDDNYKNALQEMTENNEKLIEENNYLKYVISCRESAIESLENTRDLLINKNNELISDKDKSWKNYQRKIQKKQDRINELEAQVKASEDDKQKNIEYYKKEIKNLNYRLTCKDISLEAKDMKTSIYEKRMLALEAENEKLKLDCEKLQHGYNADMIICGGRQNGKQFTFLVDLFKKLDQKKVDAAYKEAYNTTSPVWQKEVLKQTYGVYETGKWTKPPTKREEMWAEIFELHKESDVVIKVKREDVDTFLHEIENKIPEITWASSVKIFETKHTIGDIYKDLKIRDRVYFRLWKINRLSYAYDPLVYSDRKLEYVSYLPPMRWDLFKKGRLVVGVRKEHYDEFILNATENIDSFSKHNPYNDFNYSFFIFDKNAKYIEVISRSQFRQLKEINNHKVIYWEDVR